MRTGNNGKSLYFTHKGSLADLGTLLQNIEDIPHTRRIVRKQSIKVTIKATSKEDAVRIKDLIT